MKASRFLFLLIAVVGTVVVVAAKKQAKLKIETEFMPDDCSRSAGNGDVVDIHYTGSLEDGTVFDSSRTEGRDPIQFELGSGKVIPGWEQGILGMCVGEKRKLTIPPHLGYGEQGAGPIPGGATLFFEAELTSLQKGGGPTPSVDFNFQKLIPLIGVPLVAAYVIYQLWMKAANAPTARQMKESRRKGRRK